MSIGRHAGTIPTWPAAVAVQRGEDQLNYPGGFDQNVNPWPSAGQPPMGQSPVAGPGFGYGNAPGWPPAPAPRSGPSGLLIALLVLAVVVVLVIGGVAAYLLWPNGDAPVKESALSDVLLTPQEAGEILGTGPLVGMPDEGDEIFTTFGDPMPAAVDEDCDIGSPDEPAAHEGSGWTGVRVQYLQAAPTDDTYTDPNGISFPSYIQSVVAYPDASAATDFVAATRPTWEHCANRTVNLRARDQPDDPDLIWDFGAVSERDGTVTWPAVRSDTGERCVEAMAARNNLVIELEVCNKPFDPVGAEALVAKIGEKIAAAPRGD
ncbi:sensor domain-containing protein [Mycobacterium sp. TNTM28]|uniref:Sensor domain-containing protein n=1 Tax=[Mycobacterium] fortunisiensis TaxID=2600579 RepID=A0ABS6KJ62_9MYCO|nr:sensor domain-containing protein [[Mycobacterium] fortunisiensis]MBU9763631.1 sensor domain-containing protein [[Mycobacterium] fortunisiensis]